jgi:hypothetical protein
MSIPARTIRLFIMKHLALVLLLALPLSAQLVKQTEHTVKLAPDAPPEKATVADMKFLVGTWSGDGLGGETLESWAPPIGGVMLGTFVLVRDGKPVFYEFLTLAETDGGLAMRLKHFNPDMAGWEEKEKFVEFRYAGRVGNLVHFQGLTFRIDGDDALTIFLALRGKDGTLREETFRMKRQ